MLRRKSRQSREVEYGGRNCQLYLDVARISPRFLIEFKQNPKSDLVLAETGNECGVFVNLTASMVQNKACWECSSLICPCGVHKTLLFK